MLSNAHMTAVAAVAGVASLAGVAWGIRPGPDSTRPITQAVGKPSVDQSVGSDGSLSASAQTKRGSLGASGDVDADGNPSGASSGAGFQTEARSGNRSVGAGGSVGGGAGLPGQPTTPGVPDVDVPNPDVPTLPEVPTVEPPVEDIEALADRIQDRVPEVPRPSPEQLREFAQDVCSRLNDGSSYGEVEAYVTASGGKYPFVGNTAADAGVAINGAVTTFCPSQAFKLA